MKDKWLDEIRESLSDFEMDTPEGLWQSLGGENHVAKASWRRRWLVAAAVISILMIGSGVVLWVTKIRPIESNDIKYAMTNGMQNNIPAENNSTQNQIVIPISNESQGINLKQSHIATIKNHYKKTKENTDAYEGNENTTMSLLDTVQTERLSPDDQTINSANKSKKEKEYTSEGGENFFVNIYPKNRNRASDYSDKFAINISASGISNSSDTRNYWIPGLNGDDLFLGSSLATTKIQHHMPFRIGLTLQYNIAKKFSIESGLVYSRIGSDISISQDKVQSMATRSMQYVGIPLNVKFSAWSWKLINVYLSAGLTGEKCISNRFEAKYISDALPLDDFAKQSEKPFQWSVNAATGIQLKPIPNIGIFAEPGVSYYFNDGTTIPTIYKDRPCNFNLNIGIRFNINP